MKRLIFLVVATALMASCTNEREARRVLETNGYTEIRYTGFQWFACGKGDWYSTGFEARNLAGNMVDGVVCSGLIFKSSTIRF